MSSIINYSLKRDYDTNFNERKDKIIPKDLYFKTVNNDYVLEDKPQRQKLSFKQQHKYSCVDSQNHDYSKQNRIAFQYHKNDQQSLLEIHRYLKQYQYNYYKNSDIEVKNQQSQNPLQQKLNRQKLYHTNIMAGKQIAKHQNSQLDLFTCRDSLEYSSHFSLFYDKRKLQNFQNKENVVANDQFISKSQSYLSTINLPKQKPQKQLPFFQKDKNIKELVSKEQITLLKILREQNNQMKIQIDKKNIYIQQLEVKLQKYLSDRIEVQKIQALDTKQLQKKLQQAQILEQQISNQLNDCRNQLENYKNIFKKMVYSCNFSQTNILQNINLDFNTSEKIIQFLQNHIFEKTTFETFVQKIGEMKQKIQNPACHKYIHITNSLTSNEFILKKQLNLKGLWKWLKKIGKQYEIMRQKVAKFNQSNL